jgi:hypothetical protein
MKPSLLLLLFLGLFLALTQTGCKQPPRALNTQKAASHLLGAVDTSVVTWQLVHRYDPYDGGKNYSFSDNPTFLKLKADGSFSEEDQENLSSGRYYLNKDKSALALFYTDINGEKPPTAEEKPNYRHQIELFNEDSLVLQWQGRHGMVTDTWVRKEL